MLGEDISNIFYIFSVRLLKYKSIDFKRITWKNKVARINRNPFFLYNNLLYFYETIRQDRNALASVNME